MSRQPSTASLNKQQKNYIMTKSYEKTIHDIMMRGGESSSLSTKNTIPSHDHDPRSNASSSPCERMIMRSMMSTDRPRHQSVSWNDSFSVSMFDVGESPTGNTKIGGTMMDPLFFPSLPFARGIGHDIQGSRRSVSSTSHGGAQSTSGSSSPSKHSAPRTNSANGDYYQVGQTLRIESHSLPFSSSEQAHELLSKLPLGSPLFVKRTSGEWVYASLVARHRSGKRLTMSLDPEKNTRKRCDRDSWKKCLRLVNDKAVSADASFFAAIAAITTTSTAAADDYAAASSVPSVNDISTEGGSRKLISDPPLRQ